MDMVEHANNILGNMPLVQTKVDLGWANGWAETPTIVKNCKEKNHTRYWHRIGANEHMVECPICGYNYQVDSSD